MLVGILVQVEMVGLVVLVMHVRSCSAGSLCSEGRAGSAGMAGSAGR